MSSIPLPCDVQERIQKRMQKISPDLEAIVRDLGEFGLDHLKVDLGFAKVVIIDPSTTLSVLHAAAAP